MSIIAQPARQAAILKPFNLNKKEQATLEAIFAHRGLDLQATEIFAVIAKINPSLAIKTGRDWQIQFGANVTTGKSLPIISGVGTVFTRDRLRELAHHLVFSGSISKEQADSLGIHSAHFHSFETAKPRTQNAAQQNAQTINDLRRIHPSAELAEQAAQSAEFLLPLAAFLRTSNYAQLSWKDVQAGYKRLFGAKAADSVSDNHLFMLGKLLGCDPAHATTQFRESVVEFLRQPYAAGSLDGLLSAIRTKLAQEVKANNGLAVKAYLEQKLDGLKYAQSKKTVKSVALIAEATNASAAAKPAKPTANAMPVAPAYSDKPRRRAVQAEMAKPFSYDGDAIVIPAGYRLDLNLIRQRCAQRGVLPAYGHIALGLSTAQSTAELKEVSQKARDFVRGSINLPGAEIFDALVLNAHNRLWGQREEMTTLIAAVLHAGQAYLENPDFSTLYAKREFQNQMTARDVQEAIRSMTHAAACQAMQSEIAPPEQGTLDLPFEVPLTVLVPALVDYVVGDKDLLERMEDQLLASKAQLHRLMHTTPGQVQAEIRNINEGLFEHMVERRAAGNATPFGESILSSGTPVLVIMMGARQR